MERNECLALPVLLSHIVVSLEKSVKGRRRWRAGPAAQASLHEPTLISPLGSRPGGRGVDAHSFHGCMKFPPDQWHFILFFFRERGRMRERGKNIDVREKHLAWPPTGDQAQERHPAPPPPSPSRTCPAWKSNLQSFSAKDDAQ